MVQVIRVSTSDLPTAGTQYAAPLAVYAEDDDNSDRIGTVGELRECPDSLRWWYESASGRTGFAPDREQAIKAVVVAEGYR